MKHIQIKREARHILQNIDYYLTIRDYAVTKPIDDYQKDTAISRLIFEKLDSLQKELRQYNEYSEFQWIEYQFLKK